MQIPIISELNKTTLLFINLYYISDTREIEESRVLMKRKHILLSCAATLIGCFISCSNTLANYIPRLYLTGAGGYDSWFSKGQADLLLPVFSNYDRVLFLYGQTRFGHQNQDWGDDSWFGSLGVGYRQDINNDFIIGGYVLGDYNKTILGHSVTSLSPGLEISGHAWEWHVNGYIPVSNKSWKQTYWADQLGNYDYVRLQGHTRYDAKFIYYEETGPGLDSELGRTLFQINNIVFKGYVNGFYYHMQHNKDVLGAGMRITADPTSYLRLAIADSYDRHDRNVVLASARLSLYNLFSHKQHDINDLSTKLFAPIERNFGTLGAGSNVRETGGPNDHLAKPVIDRENGNPTPSPQPGPQPGPGPKPKPVPPSPSPYVENDNAWYFGNVTADTVGKRHQGDAGTAENPYSSADFDQATLDHINAYNKAHGYHHADLYLRSGTYKISGGTAQLYDNFAVYGVNSDFITPAEGDNRALLQGSLALANNNDLNDVQILFSGQQTAAAAITMDHSSNDNLSDVAIVSNSNHATAIELNDATNIMLNNVDIDQGRSDSSDSTAIAMQGVSDLTMNNSQITVVGTNSTGISMAANNQITVNNSVIKAAAVDSNSFGIRGLGKSDQATLDHTTINAASTDSGSGFGVLFGAAQYQASIGAISQNNISINDSDISGTGLNGYGVVVGYGGASFASIAGGVTDNNLKIQGSSTITGTAPQGFKDYTGDGYGVLVGYGALSYDMHQNNNMNVLNNKITISGNSDGRVRITGTGNANGLLAAGDGFGVVIGYGADVGGHAPSTIAGNEIDIDNADITGQGKNNGGVASEYDALNARGFGVLIGAGTAAANEDEDITIGSSGSENNILVSNSTVMSSSNSDIDRDGSMPNTGAAVLIGVGDYTDLDLPAHTIHIKYNNISVEDNSTITLATTGQGITGAMGVAIGDKTQNVDGDKDYISVINSTIKAQAGKTLVNDYGIFVFQDANNDNGITYNTQDKFETGNNMAVSGYAVFDSRPTAEGGQEITWPFTPGK